MRLTGETKEAAGATGEPSPPEAERASPADIVAERRERARLMTYRLFPLWLFLLTFGVTLVWESAVRGHELTTEKAQAAALIALGVALFIGAPVGIRFLNPLPPKK